METTLEYLTEMEKYKSEASILDIAEIPGGSTSIVLNKTIFYPQGGGQPSDQGEIYQDDEFLFIVKDVLYTDGIVKHKGEIVKGTPRKDMIVTLSVDRSTRIKHSRLQSAGHLLLNAVETVGLQLVAVKGYHFPDRPYVEFKGTLPVEDREHNLEKLQSVIEDYIENDVPITYKMVSAGELEEICNNVPANIPEDKPTRVVIIDGLAQPCGGTHVQSTASLEGLKVERMKNKKGNTRIYYSL